MRGIITSKDHEKIRKILGKIKRRIEIRFETKSMFPAYLAIEEGYIYYSAPTTAEHPLEDWSLKEILEGLLYFFRCLFIGKIRIKIY